jgi:hypothetical protein
MEQRQIEKWVGGAFATLLAGCLLFSTISAVFLLLASRQLDYEEGNILNAGLRITQGLTPYPDPHGWPIVLNSYGPVPYVVTAGLIKLFGLRFTAPRVITVLAGLSISVMLALLIHHWGRSWSIGIGFGSMFLCTPVARYWLPLLRVDMLGLALALAGLCVVTLAPKRWVVAVLLFVAALFVKWSLLAAPAACALHFIAKREWKRLWQMAVTGLIVTLVAFLAMQSWSSGHFAFHMFGTHPDPFSLLDYVEVVGWLLRTRAILAVLALIALGSDVWRDEFSLSSLYLLMSVFGAVTVGKSGSNTNHLLELIAALCLSGGLGWGIIAGWLRAKGKATVSALALAAVTAGLLASFSLRLPAKPSDGCEQAYAFLRAQGSRVLAENVGALLLSGKPVLLSNPFVFTQLVAHRGWSDAPLQDRLRDRQFDAVLLSTPLKLYLLNDRWPPGVLAQIEKNYHPVARFACDEAGVAFLPDPAPPPGPHKQ